MISSTSYIQPYAFHRHAPERLVLRDEPGNWYLWFGDTGNGLVEVPETLALWMIARSETDLLPTPRMWFEPDALPAREESAVFSD